MKPRALLLFFLLSGFINAQVVCDYPDGVVRTLIISEIRMTSTAEAYIEITNIGKEYLRLSDFKFGRVFPHTSGGPIFDLCADPWYTTVDAYMFLPDRMLAPGESFVLANAYDYGPIHYKERLGREGGYERIKNPGIYEVADKLIHIEERILGKRYERDSITTARNDPEQIRKRGDYSYLFAIPLASAFYLEHHYTYGDSAVIDQVGGVFDNNGRNHPYTPYDVAGVEGATGHHTLVRKANVTVGNIDFNSSRGLGAEESEWIPLPMLAVKFRGVGNQWGTETPWRDVWWTIGNHGNFMLDENTLEPLTEDVVVDFNQRKITIPWGIRRLDDIMNYFKKRPGVAWSYHLNELKSDSLYSSARTGDQLTIYVVGNELQTAVFDIEVKAPTADDNIVIPIDHPIIRLPGESGPVTERAQTGILNWPRVTQNSSGIDTITGVGFGLSFDLRADTLLKYIEKPANAEWEFIWSDDRERADLKDGDRLKVISESGKEKEYHIQIQEYSPGTNANLAAITWPDIPEYYRGYYGWKGDTIPNFGSGAYNYRVELPADMTGIPAFQAVTSDVNATVKTYGPKSIIGTKEERTFKFEVTAEDGLTVNTYYVEVFKEKQIADSEPFFAEPFFSEYINSYPAGDIFLEIYNPGNQPIDLRNYMVGYINTESTDDYWSLNYNAAWERRFYSYVPGMKYVGDEGSWEISRKKLIPDTHVNPIINGGETFVMALITRAEDYYPGVSEYFPKYDVQFANNITPGFPNTWNEEVRQIAVPFPPHGNRANGMALYKIVNDSVKQGLKPVNDPYDYDIIDIWAMPGGKYWVVGGYVMGQRELGGIFLRKPEISSGNPVRGGSFGTNEDDSEWIRIDANVAYSSVPVPERYGYAFSNLNQHFMYEPTYYKSTITSSIYKVSGGYGPDQEILGLRNGVILSELLANLNKEDEGQELVVKSSGDDTPLAMGDMIQMNDILVVTSADGVNTSIYRLDVTEDGLSSNAVLTSSRWNIDILTTPDIENAGTGLIAGFDYGTTVKAVIENLVLPSGATMTVLDSKGSFVSFIKLNFDTLYVDVTVNSDFYIEVVAEDQKTRIIYQLNPITSDSDAFILSDVYEISQIDKLVGLVPKGTNVNSLFDNISPSSGASLKLVDKKGFEREMGQVREDDKIIVTSANGSVVNVYFISFLSSVLIPQTTYLAYILSEAYSVDQVYYVISEGVVELTGQTLLDEFMNNITPSAGATVKVVDKNGVVKESGDLDDGDKLHVTSADGKIITIYSLDLDLTATDRIGVMKNIDVYPNPANEWLYIKGVEVGNRIHIYGSSGALLGETIAQSSDERVLLKNIPSGIFMIVVYDETNIIGRFKAVKK